MDIQLYMLAPVRPLSDGEANALLARLPDALRERLAGQKGGKRDESLCAYEMLRRAMQDHFGWEALPEVAFGAHGKPYFPSCSDVFFSLSHSRGAVLLAEEGRRTFLQKWQERKRETITHPFLEEKLPWGLVPYVQSLLLARYLRGDLEEYPPFLWK